MRNPMCVLKTCDIILLLLLLRVEEKENTEEFDKNDEKMSECGNMSVKLILTHVLKIYINDHINELSIVRSLLHHQKFCYAKLYDLLLRSKLVYDLSFNYM